MSKTIKIATPLLPLLGSATEFVVTGVEADSFTIAIGTQVLSVEGKLDGLKLADLVVVKDGELLKKSTASAVKQFNPSPEVMADYGL